MKLIDLHTHTFFSDGVLSPSELVYRYKTKNCVAMAITDHADYSNMEEIIAAMKKAAPELSRHYEITVLVGIELTYIPPVSIPEMIKKARSLGAEIVVVHGETSAEQVPPGTNFAAIKGMCDILAHPGYLSEEEASAAAELGVCIELTTRSGHGDTNRQVCKMAQSKGAKLVLDTDSHFPEDMLDQNKIERVLKQCGLEVGYYDVLLNNSQDLVEKIIRRRI